MKMKITKPQAEIRRHANYWIDTSSVRKCHFSWLVWLQICSVQIVGWTKQTGNKYLAAFATHPKTQLIFHSVPLKTVSYAYCISSVIQKFSVISDKTLIFTEVSFFTHPVSNYYSDKIRVPLTTFSATYRYQAIMINQQCRSKTLKKSPNSCLQSDSSSLLVMNTARKEKLLKMLSNRLSYEWRILFYTEWAVYELKHACEL